MGRVLGAARQWARATCGELPKPRGSGTCVGAEGRVPGAVGEHVECEDDARLAHADAVVADAPGRIVRPRPRARRLRAGRAFGLCDQPAHARQRPVAEAPLARHGEQLPQVVADAGGAVVEAGEVRRRPLPVRIRPVGPAQAAVGRLGDAEQEVARGHGGAPVASIMGDRVGGQEPFADRRRADVPVGLIVRSLDRRTPRPAAVGHLPVTRHQRVRGHARHLQRGPIRHARGGRRVRGERAREQERGGDEERGEAHTRSRL